MARKKKGEIVDLDEVRDMAEEATEEAAQDLIDEPGEDGEIDGVEGEPGEQAEAAEPDLESVADPGDTTKVISDSLCLRVRLTDEEIVHYSDAMIEAMDDAKRARARMKGYAAECKEDEEKALQRAEEAKALVRAKAEERPVDCEQIHNFTRGMVYTRRLDTGEIVQRRKMNAWERQSDIEEIVPGEAEPEAEAADEAQVESGEEHESPEDSETEGIEAEAEGEEQELAGVGVED